MRRLSPKYLAHLGAIPQLKLTNLHKCKSHHPNKQFYPMNLHIKLSVLVRSGLFRTSACVLYLDDPFLFLPCHLFIFTETLSIQVDNKAYTTFQSIDFIIAWLTVNNRSVESFCCFHVVI